MYHHLLKRYVCLTRNQKSGNGRTMVFKQLRKLQQLQTHAAEKIHNRLLGVFFFAGIAAQFSLCTKHYDDVK
jgi:hypothetical protein